MKRDRFVSLVKDLTRASSFMTDFMAKILDGKILFTPNNTQTQSVMGKVSLFFKMVGLVFIICDANICSVAIVEDSSHVIHLF